MNNLSYSPNTLDSFVYDNVCQGDNILARHLKAGNVKAFRTRLSKFRNADKKIDKAVLAMVTNMFRDTILHEVSLLTKKMAPLGFLIVSGGEAINKYLPKAQRSIVADIDTKFVPSVVGISANSSKYFGYIQMAKILMWYYLAQICFKLNSKNFEKKIRNKFINLKNTTVGKCLGIGTCKPTFKRRYSLLKKKKTSNNPVLIDVEIMALDMGGIKYFVPSQNRVSPKTLAGVLDIAYMRKGEVGAKVLKSVSYGLGKYDDIMVVGKSFIKKDIKMMLNLNLRPDKKDKNESRLKKVDKYFNKNGTNKSVSAQRARLTPSMITRISKLSPYYGTKYTSKPRKTKLLNQLCKPSPSSNRLYRFNVNKLNWARNSRTAYIKNEKGPCLKLYGFNPRRDAWIPSAIINKARFIPFVGI